MTELFVTDEQARVISAADTLILLRDSHGNAIGHAVGLTIRPNFSRLSPEQIAEAEQRLESEGTWYTTTQVMDRLHDLDST